MIIHNGGAGTSRDEIVLFPFDDYSIPFQRGTRLQLISYRSSAEGGTRIVVPCGPPGTPDCARISFYGAVQPVGSELWMWYLGQGGLPDDFQRVCLAKSSDGYHWEKPELGLIAYNGTTGNNLVDLGGGLYDVVALSSTLYVFMAG